MTTRSNNETHKNIKITKQPVKISDKSKLFVYLVHHFVLQLTWADLGFHVVVGWLINFGAEDQLAKRPKLSALRHRIEENPKIAAWLAKRPKTDV